MPVLLGLLNPRARPELHSGSTKTTRQKCLERVIGKRRNRAVLGIADWQLPQQARRRDPTYSHAARFHSRRRNWYKRPAERRQYAPSLPRRYRLYEQ